MANVRNNVLSQETRRRLLAAAGELFAEKGYREVSIGAITARAGASVAAVTYHFGGKEKLYRAVLQTLVDEAMTCIPPDEALTGNAGNRLRQFLLHLCRNLKGRHQPPWAALLGAREHLQPVVPPEPLYRQVFDPMTAKLHLILGELMNPASTRREIALVAASVLGQCTYYFRNPEIARYAHPQLGPDGPSADEIANHVADFTLAALRGH